MTARISVADGMLSIDDRKIPLIAGEIQFWRMEVDTWEPAVRAARDAGITMVSSYLSWRRHELAFREYDFDGRTDSRLDVTRFLRICGEARLPVQLKPGPWICAEEPGGGYPDRLLARQELLAHNDMGEVVTGYNPPFLHPVPSYSSPNYLAEVATWFAAVWDAIGGWIHPQGPVIALQLDNEPSACFQDSMYDADYSNSAIQAFRNWLRDRYDGNVPALQRAWGEATRDLETAEPPRRPGADHPTTTRHQRHDWIEFKTHHVATYLEALRNMHHAFGGRGLMYTVNLVTHPIHDVPSSHAAIRRRLEATIGEDHYYVPPLRTADIARLARSIATARAAMEPLPWIPELQAGIWRSPGELVEYPDPTPLEQEIWWGAAVALGFAGVNFYMLVDRENWEQAPFDLKAHPSPFAAPIAELVALTQRLPQALTAPVLSDVVVAWHRPDAYDAYAVTGTSRVPEVPWDDSAEAEAYQQWDQTLARLTELGLTYELWDTSSELTSDLAIPLLIPPRCGVDDNLLQHLKARGHQIERLQSVRLKSVTALASTAQLIDSEGQVKESLVTLRRTATHHIIHVVYWGDQETHATLTLPGVNMSALQDLASHTLLLVDNGQVTLRLTPGHRVLVAKREPSSATSAPRGRVPDADEVALLHYGPATSG